MLASGAVTGLGISVMHYVGMAAMRAPVNMAYRVDLFLLSIVIGVAAATAAFWFVKRFSDESKAEPSLLVGVATSLIMAVAITGMHYTGMAALIVIDPPELVIAESFAIDPHIMASAIAATLLIVLSVAQIALAIQKGTSGRIRLGTLPLLMAAMAAGLAGDPLTATVLATKAPVVVAPAMDGNMWQAEATQANAKTLRDRGMTLVGPEEGRLASGLTGAGRMTEPAALLDHLRQVLGRNGDLAGRKIVVSAGGTSEPVDPVRVITNRSSGKMGRALAEAARDRGARVVLVTAADMPPLAGAEVLRVDTVASMRSAVLSACEGADAVIMAAAVSDYRPAEVSSQKVKKADGAGRLTLELVKNDDFMLEIPEGVLRIGFAAESDNVLENARAKVRKKGLELIAANDITEEGSGFGVDTNRVTILDRHGNAECLPLMSKFDAAHRILDRIAKLLR